MKYFTIAELTDSAVARRVGFPNEPDNEAIENIKALIDNVLDPAREAYGAPVKVNSGYRCAKLNSMLGGVSDSQHLKGQAADLTTGTLTGNKRLYDILLDLPFDQLIWERGSAYGPAWIHVSYKRKGKNRGEVLFL